MKSTMPMPPQAAKRSGQHQNPERRVQDTPLAFYFFMGVLAIALLGVLILPFFI